MRYHGTDIDGVFLTPERLEVRGTNLNDLVGRFSYPQAVAHTLLGKAQTPDSAGAVEAVLAHSADTLAPDAPAIRLIRAAAAAGATPAQAVTAGLMVPGDEGATAPDSTSIVYGGLTPAMAEGLHLVARLPLYLAAAIAGSDAEARRRLEQARSTGGPYIRRIHALFLDGAVPEPWQTAVLEALFVAWHGGFGYLPPSVMMPRIAIGTGVPIRQALGAGFAAGGPNHIGACEEAIALLLECLGRASNGDLPMVTDAAIAAVLDAGRKVPGFGHPLFRTDPRAPHLRSLIEEYGVSGMAPIVAYDAAVDSMQRRTGLPPNIDFASAALFIAAGVRTRAGGTLALCARGAGMVAHMIERQAKPAFGVNSAMARKQIDLLPKNWL